MKKVFLPIIATFIVAGIYFMASAHKTAVKSNNTRFGDADALGSADDENARANYELMMLRDPATGMIPDHIREKELAFAAGLPTDADLVFGKTTSSSLVWQPRGPWNVGGRTRAMAIDVSNVNNIVAGSCSGGMWRSTDQGATWVPTTPSNQYKSVSCLSQDTRPAHTNVWYYGTGEAFGASATATGAYYLGNGVFKSTDSGVTWTALSSTTGASVTAFSVWGQLIWNLVTNPADMVNDVIYAASYGGIHKSTDGGTTWTLVKGTFGSTDSYFTDIAISKTGIIYASLSSDGVQKGIYRSVDGTTFTNITPATFPATYNRVKIGISPDDENQIYFLGNTPGYGQPDTNFEGTVEWNSLWRYTYVSGDGSDTGGVWMDRSANLPSSGGLFDKFTSQGSYDLVVKVKPGDTNTVFIGGTNLYRSTSAFADTGHTTFIGGYQQGATLPVVNEYANHHPDQHELVFMPGNPDKMISSNDGGIFMTNDNTAASVVWNPLNNGYITTMFYTCAVDHASTNDIVIGGAQDNGSWFTNSSVLTSPWVTPRGGDGAYCAIADSSKAYYFSIQSGKMMRAKLDAAGTVDSFARIDPIGGSGYLFVNPYTIDPNNNDLMYLAAGHCIWRNDDLSGIPYASNWDSISTNWVLFPDSLTTATPSITAISVSKVPANRVYYGTSDGRVYRINGANVGTPTAVNITSGTAGSLFPSGGNVSCIAVDPTNADNIMVVFSNYGVYSLYFSSNGGTSWAKVGGNLEATAGGSGNGPSCRWASILPVSGGYVYLVGTSVGLFATTQLSGLTTVWTQQGANTIGAAVVDMMDYRATDGLVVVATHSSGMFSTHITQVTDVNAVKNVSLAATMNLTNFPNPFINETNIQFDLSAPGNVSLVIYDNLGRPVRMLADGALATGQHKYSFNSEGLPAGIYNCVLRAGDATQTRSLSVIK